MKVGMANKLFSTRVEVFPDVPQIEVLDAGVHVPPQNIAAEQAVLGALLLNSASYDLIADQVSEADFYRCDHQLIFSAIARMMAKNRPVDPLTVYTLLSQEGTLAEAGGLGYLNALVESTPSAANVARYAQLVHEASVLRRLATASRAITQMAMNPEGRDAADILDAAETSIFEIAGTTKTAGSGPTDMSVLLDQVIDRVDELRRNPQAYSGIPTGFPSLDQMTCGLQPGSLVVLAGRPAMGKTALALNIASNIARAGRSVLVFSLEMGGAELAGRVVAAGAGVDAALLKRGKVSASDMAHLRSVADNYREFAMQVDATANMTPSLLRSRAKRFASRNGTPGLIVVDYLQLIRSDTHGKTTFENRATEVAEISRSLKALAKELDCPVMALSQLNRSLEARDDKRPRMSDLRESGAIEQDADIVMFVYRDVVYNKNTPDPEMAEIIIGKHRSGQIGSFACRFNAGLTQFQENQSIQRSDGVGR